MRKRHLSILIAPVLVAAFLVALVQPAFAYLIKTNARPTSPAIAYATRYGTYLMVWAEDRGTGTGMDLYAARLTKSGIVQGYEVPVVVAAGNQSDPTLAYSEQVNEFMLAFTDDSAGQQPSPITPGIPTPPNPGLPTPIPGPGGATATIPVPPPPPLMGWTEGSGAAGGRAAEARIPAGLIQQADGFPPAGLVQLAPNGDAAGLTFQSDGRALDANSPDQPPTPPVQTATPGPSPTPGGNPIPPTSPGSRDIYGTFLAVGGQRVSQVFQIVTSPADDTYPDLAYMPRGGSNDQIALVWREVTGVESSIHSLKLTPYGRFFTYGMKGNVVTGGDLGRPSVAAEVNKGEFLAAWSQTPTDDPARDLFARRLNSNAFPVGPVIKLVTAKAPVDDVYPSVSSLFSAGGGYLLAWERRTGGAAPDIQTRRLNQNGIPYRNENALAGGPAFSFAPDVSATVQNSTLVVWVDRNAASDNSIMAAEVTRDGRRIGPERVVVQGGTGPSALTPVAPPGFPTLPPPPLPTP
jgi:hypothetical protein